MSDIVMKSEVYVVDKIKKCTTAEFFQDIKIGDRLEFSVPLCRVGRGRGLYATCVTVKNLTQGSESARSMNEMENRLANFDLVEFIEKIR